MRLWIAGLLWALSGAQQQASIATTDESGAPAGYPNLDQISDQPTQPADRMPSIVQLTGIRANLGQNLSNGDWLRITAASTNPDVVEKEIAVDASMFKSTGKLAYRTTVNSGSSKIVVTAVNSFHNITVKEFMVTTDPQPVECIYGPYSAFGPCSAACGLGLKKRRRVVLVEGANGGSPCDLTTLTQQLPCQTNVCTAPSFNVPDRILLPISADPRVTRIPVTDIQSFDVDTVKVQAWNKGVSLGAYNATVDRANRGATLTFEVLAGSLGRNTVFVRVSDQFGYTDKQVKVDISTDPLDCVVGWGQWTECSSLCGEGTRVRREEIQTHSANGGAPCRARREESEACVGTVCSAGGNCRYSWAPWSDCSLSCGTGTRMRSQILLAGATNGLPCDRPVNELETCKLADCPTNCQWEWGSWSACSAACGGGLRVRAAVVTAEATEGGQCTLPLDQTEQCNANPCKADCVWEWGEWGICSQPCGGGTRTRVQVLKSPAVSGGICLPALPEQTENCNPAPCSLKTCKNRCGLTAAVGQDSCNCDLGCQFNCCSDISLWCPQVTDTGSGALAPTVRADVDVFSPTNRPTSQPTAKPSPAAPTAATAAVTFSSCFSRCGERPPFSLAGAANGVCACDSGCSSYQDCCSDYEQFCGANAAGGSGNAGAGASAGFGFGAFDTASAYSCTTAGCGSVHPQKTCSCSEGCGPELGQIPCCSDYALACAVGCSSGTCGQEVRGCFCTNDCHEYGDCCASVKVCNFASHASLTEADLTGLSSFDNGQGRRRRV
mmetsp:Transcript_29756/g.58269  ORF Transcript_29756/g.58269 Transcript_29756/m.58269 type:complete len:780 (+) Transcript_29756:47-2386(+)